ncbi:MAG: GNAT family N-acetyltransferase [Caulobacteraceae bacterium]|nr:GNAT family N-acetyltransferase [Caulobacteraceae bacterium]
MPQIRKLTPDEVETAAPALADLLLDCVAGGASIGFMDGMTAAEAAGFWRAVAGAAASDGRVVLVAEDETGLLGTVQMIPAAMPNQPHRFDIAKMQVDRRARRQGIGEALMRAAEAAALAQGRTVGVLDTADATAARLYERCGWTRVGEIPAYALLPNGELCGTTFSYLRLA